MTLPTITATGNLAADPDLRFTQGGLPIASFRIGCSERRYDKGTQQWLDGDTTWLNVNVWRSKGEACAEQLRKGDTVTVTGKLRMRTWEKDGQKRTAYDVDADDVGKTVKPPRQAAPVQTEEAPF